ncbi:MAG: MFS transporter, partial [Verrucomicrobia bacterium]|nr:MFS transporter [Verrucomicrobiota bacterium]
YAYSCLFIVATALGVGASVAVSRLPETTMAATGGPSTISLLVRPFRDQNFRRLLVFIGFWGFAVNMAAPFFIIYMIQRIGLPLGLVTILTVVSQLSHMLFLNFWGSIADRYSSKSGLLVSGPLFLLTVLAWNFTTLPERYFFTIPLLFIIHIVSGLALAGVNICASAIALKLSPSERAHGHMTVFSLVGALCGAVGPVIGGLLADYFDQRELAVSLHWSDPLHAYSVSAMNFKSLDFVFVLTFIVGIFSIHRLAFVKEEGEVPQGRVISELLDQVILPFRMITSIEGVRNRMAMPVAAVFRGARRRLVSPLTRDPESPPDHRGSETG